MRAEIRHRILQICAYLYLVTGYAYIIYNFSYIVRITNKPLGWFMLNVGTLDLFAIYVLINHLLVKKIISTKILYVFEVLLFIAFFTLWWSDIMYENRPA